MKDVPTSGGLRLHWEDRLAIRVINRVPQSQVSKGLRSPHFWIISVVMAIIALLYYSGHTPLARFGGFFSDSFPHDLHRALFLIPLIYAALTFRVRGALVTSLIFLCAVLPRGFYSPYAEPLVRAVLFVLFSALIGMLSALLIDRVEKEEMVRVKLSMAYQEAMSRLRENEERLIQAEKLTSLGQLAASIAHEINNPLAGVLVYTKLLSKKIASDNFEKKEVLDQLSKIETEVGRCSGIIRNLLDFARQSMPTLRPVDVNQVLEQVLSLVGHQAQLQKVEVVKEFRPSLPPVLADFNQLQQVFTNLTLNAIQAMPNGGTLRLRTSVVDSEVRVDVQDTGCGIPKENFKKLFTPFFTTKEKGKGVGLGLAVVHGIIERHKGRVEVQSEVGKGSTFSVFLKVSGDERGQDTSR